jgi:thymidine phosphorylase
MPGILFYVVGPSGSGKDTLIDGAKASLAATGAFVFARRVITRPADSPGEAHEATDEADFARRRDAGEFLLAWKAHGLRYGLPRDLLEALEAGRHVVANGSRAVAADLARRVPHLVILEVWAPPETLQARIAARGREAGQAVAERLARRTPDLPADIPVIRVANDGAPAEGVQRFVTALREAAASAGR